MIIIEPQEILFIIDQKKVKKGVDQTKLFAGG